MELLLALIPELGLSWGAAMLSKAELSLLRRLWQIFSIALCPARGVILEFSSWGDAQKGEHCGNSEDKGEGK